MDKRRKQLPQFLFFSFCLFFFLFFWALLRKKLATSPASPAAERVKGEKKMETDRYRKIIFKKNKKQLKTIACRPALLEKKGKKNIDEHFFEKKKKLEDGAFLFHRKR